MTTYHVTFDLDGLIHRGGAAELAGQVRLPGATAPATAEEIVAHATVLKAMGYKVLPSCALHDPQGFCRGHRDEDGWAEA
jgi:hypothetical protein